MLDASYLKENASLFQKQAKRIAILMHADHVVQFAEKGTIMFRIRNEKVNGRPQPVTSCQ